jgi:hypothetical protein
MSLTGLPLIVLTGLLGLVAVAAAVRGWRLAGRKRMPVRLAALVAVEVLLVAGVGLVANRHEGFYPSWRALGGSENVVTVPPAPAGRLDGELDHDGAVPWSPPGIAAWHLAAAPLLIVPPGYARHPNLRYPVVVALTSKDGASRIRTAAGSSSGTVTVVLVPTRQTTAALLAPLSGLLGQDARVADGLVLLADPVWAPLAAAWPGWPTVIAGHTAAAFEAAARVLPAPLAAPQELPS